METKTQPWWYSPRQVGSVCTGMEPWQLFILTEQVTWTNSGGMSSCGPLTSSGESASRMLKESWSWLTVLESERDWSSPSVWELVPECSSYSTTRSVSLSVMMQQPNMSSAHQTDSYYITWHDVGKSLHSRSHTHLETGGNDYHVEGHLVIRNGNHSHKYTHTSWGLRWLIVLLLVVQNLWTQMEKTVFVSHYCFVKLFYAAMLIKKS